MKRFSTSAMKCSVKTMAATVTTRGRPGKYTATLNVIDIDELTDSRLAAAAPAMIIG